MEQPVLHFAFGHRPVPEVDEARRGGGAPFDGRLLLRVEEAADVLGLSRSTVYELMGRGVIPSVRIGGCRRIPAKALRAWVEGLEG